MNEEKGDARPDKFSYSDLQHLGSSEILPYDLYIFGCSWYFKEGFDRSRCLMGDQKYGAKTITLCEDKINRFADAEEDINCFIRTGRCFYCYVWYFT
jgi:tRNA uridine 5-carboxymethylaminomethyl modification enzyme